MKKLRKKLSCKAIIHLESLKFDLECAKKHEKLQKLIHWKQGWRLHMPRNMLSCSVESGRKITGENKLAKNNYGN